MIFNKSAPYGCRVVSGINYGEICLSLPHAINTISDHDSYNSSWVHLC